MAQLNLRGVDDGLVRELKAEAARDGVSLLAYCVGVLAARKGGERGQGLVLSPGTVRGVAREDVLGGVPSWPELASAQTPKLIDPEVSADEAERQRRRDKKAARHQELKQGAMRSLDVDSPDTAKQSLAKAIQSPPLVAHSPACNCLRCQAGRK